MADFLKGYGPTTSAGEGESEKEKKITKLDLIKKYIINYLLPVMFALIFVCAAACLAVMFYKLQKTNNNLYHNTTLYIEDKIWSRSETRNICNKSGGKRLAKL